MEKEVLKVRQDIYALLSRICKQEAYSSYVLLPTKAISNVLCHDKNSTFRPFLPLFYYFFRFLRLPVLCNKKYQSQFLPIVFRDILCSPVPENFPTAQVELFQKVCRGLGGNASKQDF